MSVIKIEKNIPMPEGNLRGRTPIWQNLLREMEVGDSVVVTPSQAFAIKKASMKLGLQTRQSNQGCPKGKVRVWRVA